MTNALISELFRIAATWTDDKAVQSSMVNAWMLGRTKSLPRVKGKRRA